MNGIDHVEYVWEINTVADVDITESDGAMYKMSSVEIHTIEEMIKLSDAVGGRLVIETDEYERSEIPEIEIYDFYRE